MYISFVSAQALLLAFSALTTAAEDSKPAESAESSPAALSEPAPALVSTHLFPACNGRRARKIITLPTDTCITIPGFGLEIREPALCANGTRAQLARFEDRQCGHGTISEKLGLLDVKDTDIGQGSCVDMAKIESVAFWCEGMKKSSPDEEKEKESEDEDEDEDEDMSKKGSVSESACIPGKAPFFAHPKTDTCVELKTQRMKVFSKGTCSNGTKSTLALYGGKGCAGSPSFRELNKHDMKTCLDLKGVSSYAFYCTGEGVGGDDKTPGKPRQGGSAMQFFLVLSLICMMFFLILVLSVLTWVRKYGGSAGKIIDFLQGFLKPKDGSIAI